MKLTSTWRTRRTLMFGVYTAHTQAQIEVVRREVDDWLQRDPEDKAIQRAQRLLEKSEERLRKAENGTSHEKAGAPA
jgi:hypothetical protein